MDVTASGPGGTTYKVTTSAALTCLTSTTDVEYTVDIVNPCPTAVLTVDSAGIIFLANTVPSLTYNVGDAAGNISWKTSVDVSTSITWTDPCGAIV